MGPQETNTRKGQSWANRGCANYGGRITEMNLTYLKEAVRVAEERLATLKNHFGQEAIANLDRRGHERTNVLNDEQQKSLSFALPKLQLWPGNKDSEKDLRVYAEAIQNLPPVQDIAAPVEEAENYLMMMVGLMDLEAYSEAKVVKTNISETNRIVSKIP